MFVTNVAFSRYSLYLYLSLQLCLCVEYFNVHWSISLCLYLSAYIQHTLYYTDLIVKKNKNTHKPTQNIMCDIPTRW